MSASPAFSSSSKSLDDHHDQLIKAGFKFTLTRVDSGGNFTTFERLHRQMKRGRSRLTKFNEMILGSKHRKISSTVYPGSGEFLMNLSIGTPPIPYYAIVDTGSDLIWTQSKPCLLCFHQPTPVFDPKKSSSYSNVSCSSNLCKALPYSNCSSGCDYFYSYGDGDSTSGVLATETFTFEKVRVPNIGFGCGLFDTGMAGNGAGLVGLGRGPLSLVSQLDEPKFSYCLTSFNGTKPSTLSMGSQASSMNCPSSSSEMKTTPLIKNPVEPYSTFYYLSLEGITVGSTRLLLNKTTFALHTDGTGGLIIDSGTAITHLVESAFTLVEKEFISQVKLPIANEYNSIGLLCFKLPSGSVSVDIPSLVFHFQDADLDLPRENYMITDSGVMCLAMTNSSDDTSVFGNIQQQNFLVVHDLCKETVSFTPAECDRC